MDLIKYPLDTAPFEEVIARLGEECSEVIKEIFKGHRFGFHAHSPIDETTPMQRLLSEVRDVKNCLTEFEKRIVRGEHL
ncbi:hypothetical protein KEU06_08830 [Pseudaminobacter sp. 19-2017]|uniref:Uncharacterized protein n=1 Tax=Pseudaminobacter soli (ex Zhang et al. 2022) TaxID=2831468 RepID=A0A942E599_9HYPH|nr:hypothetical protein [Pseudaminobacter soli]MBS3648732.1 hypothetical protein [Pseudaminobacter soli]